MKTRIALIDIVALTRRQLSKDKTPFLYSLLEQYQDTSIKNLFPALTCSSQTSLLTGTTPSEHGIIGNGWYSKDDAEIKFWKQSHHLTQQDPFWKKAKSKKSQLKVAKLFWWYNMYSGADYSITPRPMYPADGRKIPDIYTYPSDFKKSLVAELGEFPLFNFWGPTANIKSSQWIADSARFTEEKYSPDLSLIYIPHLDYAFQKFGPNHSKSLHSLKELDLLLESLFEFFKNRNVTPIFLSEYSIQKVENSISPNIILRKNGLLAIREELGRELLDPGASRAFAIADHQVSHVYIQKEEDIERVYSLFSNHEGIEQVLTKEDQQRKDLYHQRSPELLLISKSNYWFNYYYWFDENKAPDFARTVDIHRKPGYDPVEMFFDPQKKLLSLQVALKIFKKKIGQRTLMDFIPLDSSLVKGSHGREINTIEDAPLLLIPSKYYSKKEIQAKEISSLISKILCS